MEALGGSRYRVGSVARAVQALDLLAAGPRGGLSATELATAMGMSKSACFSLLQTLLETRMLIDVGEGQSRRYLLGSNLIRLGERAKRQLSLIDISRPVLADLAAELGLAVRLGVLLSDGISVVDMVEPPGGGLRIDLGMGDLERLHTTALGKAILADMPDERVAEMLGDGPLDRPTRRSLGALSSVRGELIAVRKRGYAVDDEEDSEGVVCIGASIHGFDGLPVGAISATTLVSLVTVKRRAEIGQIMARGAGRISRELGYQTR